MTEIKLLNLLTEKSRYQILKLLIQDAEEELCVSEVAKRLGVSKSAISHQLANLEAEEIVFKVRYGRTVCYKINTNPKANLAIKLIELFKPFAYEK